MGRCGWGPPISSAELAPGGPSANAAGVSGGAGSAVVGVTGCTAAGLAEPVIVIQADHDPGDTLIGNNSAGTAAAYVTGWSPSGSTLEFNVSTYDPINGTTANSDFSFAAYC